MSSVSSMSPSITQVSAPIPVHKEPRREQKVSVDKLVDIVIRQTNYTREEALEKLKETQYQPLDVIRNYLRQSSPISTKEKNTSPSPLQTSTLNKTKFDMMRRHLDISKYQNDHPIAVNDVSNCFARETHQPFGGNKV